jgi:alkylation response protein AidB-like acyl-CoA dehydrogenase
LESNFENSVKQLSKLGLLKDQDTAILERADAVCEKLSMPEYESYIERKFDAEAPKILAESGLMGLPIDPKYGGLGVNMLVHALAMERLGQVGMGVVTLVDVHQFLGSLVIQNFGSEEQRSRLLPEAARGESIFAYALTEPEAGSDPSSMSTTFSDDGDGYLINGSKYLISNGSIARYVIVFARSSEAAGHPVSAFVVDAKNTPGFEVAMHLSEKLGLFTSDTALLEFHDMKVPKDSLVGTRGKGLSIAYSALLNGRIGIGSGCIGVMEDCLNSCVERARSRTQHGKSIGKHQLIQEHLARMATDLESSRWPVYVAAMMKDELDADPTNLDLRARVDKQSATAKLIASTNAYDAADRAVQVFGGFGYSILSPVGKHLLDSRVARIYEGTDEIMELKIASSLLGREFEAYK